VRLAHHASAGVGVAEVLGAVPAHDHHRLVVHVRAERGEPGAAQPGLDKRRVIQECLPGVGSVGVRPARPREPQHLRQALPVDRHCDTLGLPAFSQAGKMLGSDQAGPRCHQQLHRRRQPDHVEAGDAGRLICQSAHVHQPVRRRLVRPELRCDRHLRGRQRSHAPTDTLPQLRGSHQSRAGLKELRLDHLPGLRFVNAVILGPLFDDRGKLRLVGQRVLELQASPGPGERCPVICIESLGKPPERLCDPPLRVTGDQTVAVAAPCARIALHYPQHVRAPVPVRTNQCHGTWRPHVPLYQPIIQPRVRFSHPRPMYRL